MKMLRCLVPAVLAFPLFGQPGASVAIRPGRDARQAIDEEYTKRIRQYTTEPFFNSPLTDYLPASKSVPTPMAVLGDVAGAPGILPYSHEVYRYMRMLEKASPRVKVYSIGKTEEGREMIAVAVAAEPLLAQLDENRARLAKLADPRSIKLGDAEADKLIAAAAPVYYITGTIHSPETGAPTALMELAYRLAVDDSAYVKFIRDHVITLITPIVEVDGRDRMVDIYRWHLANPGKQWPPLAYWGHYVAHDNNRDSMGLMLQLTRNVLNTYVGWKAQVLHDLHESVPYLYDNTIGDGPYNAWIDPILSDEWQMMGWNNVSEMTKFGMPGVFAHGTFDTWSPSYLMFIAAMHNGISRLYETFGNGGADTEERTLRPEEFARTWYRQNPPLPKAKWSQRNNNNYEETGVLTALAFFAANDKLFLHNFYLKAKRSIEKPHMEGPAAYVFSADDARPGAQADLLRTLQDQGCEISRASDPFTVMMPAKKAPPKGGQDGDSRGDSKEEVAAHKPAEKPKPEPRTFPAGSYIVRMDQPYSRIADALLDYQYWSPNDPQKDIYDDTGWTFGELGDVQVARVTDLKVLDAAMTRVEGPVKAAGGVEGDGAVFLINHNADDALITLRYSFPKASFEAAEESFEAGGRKFNRGSFIVRNVAADDLRKACADLGLRAYAGEAPANVKTHPVRAARIAFLHTWQGTQGEGWWRLVFDRLKIPYDYISTQTVSTASYGSGGLRAKYDAIVFAPGGRGNPQGIINGMPMYGNPLPWKATPLTPNLGKIDETDDMRPGLGWNGLARLQEFVRQGGLFITASDTTSFAVTFGFAPGVTIAASQKLKVTGSALRSKTVDTASPIVYGYSDNLAIFSSNPPIFNIANMVGGFGGGRRGAAEERERPTGRGTADDPDVAQGRAPSEIPEEPHAEKWEALPLTDEQLRRPFNVIPPAARPRVVLRYANAKELLVSGLLDNGAELAQHPAVIDAPYGEGHVVLFSNNPFWRGETRGSHFLVFNAILNFDSLNAGRKLADR